MKQSKRMAVKHHCLFLAILCMLAVLVGCAKQTATVTEDILSQKKPREGRTPITVLVKYAFSINAFETAVEQQFPDIDLVQVGNYTADMGIAEYEARLKNDDLTDIVMTWPLDVGEEYWDERLLDLSGLDFSSGYNLAMLNDISKDGKLYYLPGPAQVRGIVYNQTLFAENDWVVPKNFEEFVTLCETIENSGMRSLQLGLSNKEVLDTAFTGYSFGSCFGKPQDAQWLKNYNMGVGSFADQFMPGLESFQRLIDAKILQEKDLSIGYADREYMLFNRQCAMIEDSVLMARMGHSLTGTTDSFALMPFFDGKTGEEWARAYAVCYIGLNKQLTQNENKEKYQKVIKLMEYVSTPKGQEALMGDTGAMLSSLSDMSPPQVSEIDALLPALTSGHYGVFPQLKNAQESLRQGLAGMLRGTYTAAEVVKMVDAQNANPPVAADIQVLGEAAADFSLTDTGSFIADCMKEAADTDFALILDNGKDGKYNGMGVSGRLYKGDITASDIKRVLPDFKRGETGALLTLPLTGAQLLYTLEHSVLVDNSQGGWFYYFSGLIMELDPTAEQGDRIQNLRTTAGAMIDTNKVYTVAIMEQSVPEAYMTNAQKTDTTVAQILQEKIEQAKTISPAQDGRLQVVRS